MTDVFERFVAALVDGVLAGRYVGTEVQALADNAAELVARRTSTRPELSAALTQLFLAVEREARAFEELQAQDAAEKVAKAEREAKKHTYQPRRYKPCKVLPPIYRGDPNKAILGDPPPGRSALDQKRLTQERTTR